MGPSASGGEGQLMGGGAVGVRAAPPCTPEACWARALPAGTSTAIVKKIPIQQRRSIEGLLLGLAQQAFYCTTPIITELPPHCLSPTSPCLQNLSPPGARY